MSVNEPFFKSEDGSVVLHRGDCVEVMSALPSESIDALVTDP